MFNQNTKLFILEHASENIVCEKAAILSRGDELKHDVGLIAVVFIILTR